MEVRSRVGVVQVDERGHCMIGSYQELSTCRVLFFLGPYGGIDDRWKPLRKGHIGRSAAGNFLWPGSRPEFQIT